jgi:DUF1680 family protein
MSALDPRQAQMPQTRRTFLQSLAVTSLAAAAPTPVPVKLKTFNYSDVQLGDGPLKRQFDQNHSFFFDLPDDRLLKIYRQRVGLPAPGEDMGGWYDDFCPGAHFGQYVSALARFACATHSAATKAKVHSLISGYSQTIDPTGKFFEDLRYPAYTYDKLVLALIDAHSLLDDPNALKALYATTEAARPHMAERALTGEEQNARPHKDETYTWDETYTLAENLFLAYERTHDPLFFDMGKRYLLDKTFFDPLSEGQNVLPGLHAYSHVNALSSGMQGYFKLGDEKYLRAVTNSVDMIWKDQSFATGGWGPNEAFVEPGKGLLGASLDGTHRSFETPCGAYAHFKVMRYLLTLTQDARYGDSMEKVLYNTVLGAKPIQEDGSSFYYSDYHHSAKKTFRLPIADSPYRWDHDARWPCCSGTLPQMAADYLISAYFRSPDGIYVNLYVPSKVRWTSANVHCGLAQQTSYPHDSLSTFTVTVSAPHEMAIYFRVPGWAGTGTSLSVNGKRVKGDWEAGSFAALRRTWKSGDRVELELNQTIRTPPVDAQHLDEIAIVRGPQVLFAVSESQPLVHSELLTKPVLTKGQGNDWSLDTSAGAIQLRPFVDITDETYQTYLRTS